MFPPGRSNMSPKLLILGFDGASLPLIEKWASQGELPFFARLMREGAWGLLKSTPNFGSASAWPSFYTGLNPGKHGMFDFFYREKHSYEMKWRSRRYYEGTPFWKIASGQNVKSAILNMPVTFPAEPFFGIQVSDWTTPKVSSPGFTFPRELSSEIRKNVGRHIFAPSVKDKVSAGNYTRAFKSLRESFDYKLRLCLYLMDKYPVDIFAHTWIATDQAAHYFWNLIDENHPLYSPLQAQKHDRLFLEIYKMCDEAARLLHDKFGGSVIIMSDHGAGPNPLGEPHLKSLLAQTGFLKMKTSEPSRQTLFSRSVGGLFSVMQGLLSRPLKRFLIANFPGLLNFALTRQNLSDVDWPHTTVYTFIEPTVNLAGREPQGSVPPEQRDDYLRRITEILYSVRDTRTGKPAVEKVFRKEEVYTGNFLEDAPDLLIIWKDNLTIENLEFDYQGKKIVTSPHYTDHRTGNHKPYGIFFAKGEAVKESCRINTLEITDLFPLTLYLSGCSLPDNIDGKMPVSIIRDEWLANSPVSYFSPASGSFSPSEESPEDIEASRKRLQDLGYL